MAGPPSIFVRGPSVNPNSAVAAPFLRNIQDITQNRRRNATTNKQIENTKLFRDATLEQADERLLLSREAQEFAQGAEGRQRDRNITQGQELAGLSKGLAFSGANRLEGLSQIQSSPEFQALSDETGASRVAAIQAAGRTLSAEEIEKIHMDSAKDQTTKLGFQNQFILNNPGAGADPAEFAKNLSTSLMQSGNFTIAEARANTAAEVSALFPTMSEAKQIALIRSLKPSAAATKQIFNNGTPSRSSSSDSFKDEFSAGGAPDRERVADSIASSRGLPNTPTMILGTNIRADINDNDPARSDISSVVGRLAADGVVSGTAARSAVVQSFQGNGKTLKDDFNFLIGGDGFANLLKKALATQKAEQEKTNTKTGSNQTAAQAGGGTAAASLAQQIYQEQVNSILAKGSPRRQTDQDLANQFLTGLNPAQPAAPLLPPPGGDQTATPPPPSTQTGSTELDKLLNGTDAAAVSAVTPLLSAPPSQQPARPTAVAPTIAERNTADLKTELTETQGRVSIFGNATPKDKATIKKLQKEVTKRDNAETIADIEKQLRAMPRPDQRGIAQNAYARSLEKQLRELKG